MNYKKIFSISLLACIACFSPAYLEGKKMSEKKMNQKAHTVKEVKNKQEFDALLKNNKLVIAKFHSPACPHCVVMAPIFEELSVAYPDIAFASVSAFENGDKILFDEYTIGSYPTFLFFKSGKTDSQQVGGSSKKDFENKIKTFAKK